MPHQCPSLVKPRVWDAYLGFQLYHSDPSGNYAGWRANAIGAWEGGAPHAG